jgi:hypothetical protein
LDRNSWPLIMESCFASSSLVIICFKYISNVPRESKQYLSFGDDHQSQAKWIPHNCFSRVSEKRHQTSKLYFQTTSFWNYNLNSRQIIRAKEYAIMHTIFQLNDFSLHVFWVQKRERT